MYASVSSQAQEMMSSIESDKVVTTLVDKGSDTYQRGKKYAANSSYLRLLLGPIEAVESQAKRASTYVPQDAVDRLDKGVYDVIQLGSGLKSKVTTLSEAPARFKQDARVYVHERLSSSPAASEDIDLVQDVKDTISGKVASGMDRLEGVVDAVLPAEQEGEQFDRSAPPSARAREYPNVMRNRVTRRARDRWESVRTSPTVERAYEGVVSRGSSLDVRKTAEQRLESLLNG